MPQRVKKLMGTLTKRGIPDKSMYNLEKWKPLIDLPFKISNKCCSIMKKNPIHKFIKESGLKPMTGQMACESRLRMQQWLRNGCNGFEMKSPISNPMSFWTEQDVLAYAKKYNVKIPSVYGTIIDCDENNQPMMCGCGKKLCTTGCDRTGCVYCGYGCHLEKESRFLKLKKTHPRLYEYCIGGGEWVDGLWQPTPKGLGFGYVFDRLNEIYGKNFIKYK